MEARRILMTCFTAIILMMAMPTDVLAITNNTAKAQREKQARRDSLTDFSQKEDQRPVAMFDDIMNAMRICLSRTQRLFPSHSPEPDNTQARSIESHIHDLLCNPQNFSQRQEATLLPSFVSRAYYVIALRHILC